MIQSSEMPFPGHTFGLRNMIQSVSHQEVLGAEAIVAVLAAAVVVAGV